jgi:hypothetical protein
LQLVGGNEVEPSAVAIGEAGVHEAGEPSGVDDLVLPGGEPEDDEFSDATNTTDAGRNTRRLSADQPTGQCHATLRNR